MQTFLPYACFAESAVCLDRRRLCKQRLECDSIVGALCYGAAAWASHPAVAMWRGYAMALMLYADCVEAEWLDRGYSSSRQFYSPFAVAYPPWLGDPAFHASHRSNLLRKMPSHYSKFGWPEPAGLPYVWPRSDR